jgi:hypothetical protein
MSGMGIANERIHPDAKNDTAHNLLLLIGTGVNCQEEKYSYTLEAKEQRVKRRKGLGGRDQGTGPVPKKKGLES